eukprot:16435576-Heterocapsa_arctica.AAC.1
MPPLLCSVCEHDAQPAHETSRPGWRMTLRAPPLRKACRDRRTACGCVFWYFCTFFLRPAAIGRSTGVCRDL